MINLQFTSNGLPVDTFQILELNGEEEMSHLFRFELRLVSRDPNIDFKSMLESTAFIAITTQDKTRYIHGMLSEFEQSGAWHSGLYEYNAVLVPRLWMMTQSLQNQIYQKQTVSDIIQGELDNISQKGGHPLIMSGLTSADYEIHTVRSYDEREYVVQYKETDFNFISRLMEHEGIYYYFEHDEEVEKVVITDEMVLQQGDDLAPVMFQAEAAVTTYTYNAVSKLSRSQKQIPGSVLVKDFNYRSPSLPMQATGDVAVDGIGFVTEFGAHFKSPEEGEAIANIRAEEYRCRQNVYNGESNISNFSCGHLYSLINHFRDDFNQDYLITKVIHHASQAIQSWGNVGDTSYHNEFSCIPSDLPFRPQRLTPKPKLYGIMNGVIDSEQDMNRADIDEEGRYKVMMPFDISGTAPGKASRRIRMAQPYGGGGSGMSFPLVKGTEVIWTCIDGDIDRPIITGAVPNPLNPNVTTAENNTSNVIKTSSGITMGFHDGSGGGASQNTTGGGAGGGLAEQRQFQSILPESQSKIENHKKVTETPIFPNASMLPEHTVSQSLKQQQQQVDVSKNMNAKFSGGSATAGADLWSGPGKRWMVQVPDYDETGAADTAGSSHNDSFLRLGYPSTSEKTTEGGWETKGWLDFTDGDHTSVAKGDRTDYTDGTYTELSTKSNYSYKLAASSSYAMTLDNTHSLGLKTSSSAGLSVSTSLAANLTIKSGVDFTFANSRTYSYTKGKSFSSSGNIIREAKDTVRLKVDPDISEDEEFLEKKLPDMSKKLAIASSAVATAITLGGVYGNKDVANGFAATHGAMIAAVGAGLMGYTGWKTKAVKGKDGEETDEPASELFMAKNKAHFHVTGYKGGTRSMELKVGKNFKDKHPVKMELLKSGEDGIIKIEAVGDKGYIELRVGESMIKILPEEIKINSKKITVEAQGGQEKMSVDKDGLTLAKKHIKVLVGNVEAKKGAIESKSGKISDKLDVPKVKTRSSTIS